MKTARKLCQTMLSFILVCSMFFGTGITSVIAEGIDPTVVQNNLYDVETLIGDFEDLERYQNYGTDNMKNTINSIKDQLDIIQNMIDSGDLQGLAEKNDYLVAIYNILDNILNHNANLLQLVSRISDNCYKAFEDLKSADDLGYDEGRIHSYITGRIEIAENNNDDALATALGELDQFVTEAENIVNPYYEDMMNEDYGEYEDIFKSLYSEFLKMIFTVPSDVQNDEDALGMYNELLNKFVDFSSILPDVGMRESAETIQKIISNNSLKELVVNGLELDVKELSHTVYVGYELENLEVIATAEDSRATVSITKPDVLIVGDNAVSVKVVALNGDVKEYKVNVVKLEKTADQGDAQEPTTPVEETKEVEETITYVSNDTKDEVEEETTTEKEEDKEEYDEEIEEESGLNGFTILLIVGGIALIGFGIYMLFGDKDEEIPKVKETKKVEVVKQPEVKKQNKTNNNKNSNKSKKKNRK